MFENYRSLRYRHILSTKRVVICLFMLILGACTFIHAPATTSIQVTQVQISSSSTPVNTKTDSTLTSTGSKEPSWTPSQISQLTSEPSPTDIPWYFNFADLSPGQYLLYEDRYPETFIISANGQENRKLAEDTQWPFRSHGRQMWRLGGNLLDWEQNHLIVINISIYACGAASISPNLDLAASVCKVGKDGGHWGKVILYDIKNGAQKVLFEKEDNIYNFFDIPWSPDGKWLPVYLAYPNRKEPSKSLGKPDAGLYLWDVPCLMGLKKCAVNPRGPFKVPIWVFEGNSWSPDSRYIAFSSTRVGGFEIFDVESGEYRSLLATAGYDPIRTLAWSPDGKWLAYTRRESESDNSVNIYLMPAVGGPSKTLVKGRGDAVILDWITVSLLIQIGEEYLITQDGANLNLRSDLSLSSENLALLHVGERIKIIDGPVGNNGYRWWKIRLQEDGMEGWVAEHPDWFKSVDLP